MVLMENGLKSSTPANTNMNKAKRAKNDEFYTRYDDIEAEVMEYKEQFQDKIVYLPCDSLKSEFWSFFINNFQSFGLKKLIATHYEKDGQSYKVWSNNGNNTIQEDLTGNGDFRSPECIEILKECDIVCTNPPFSLFREFVDTIMSYNKLCLIIGSQNSVICKGIFKLMMDNKLLIGHNKIKDFYRPDGSIQKFGNICWFTNMGVNKHNEEIVLTKTYNPTDYPKYDNYDAIEVGRVANIPKDYDGVMGVPVTFFDKLNPTQFEILGCSAYSDPECYGCGSLYVNKKKKYTRILIRRKK